jgi:hypothetical protein
MNTTHARAEILKSPIQKIHNPFSLPDGAKTVYLKCPVAERQECFSSIQKSFF